MGGVETEGQTTLSPSAPRREGQALERGAELGRYLILEQLGAGGMGVVYAAYDPELDRKLALKMLHGGPNDESTEGRTRLVREAQAMAKLAHPNVVTVHDVGTFASQVFVAMEFVDGETLTQWRKKDRSWREVLDAFVAAGRGLSAAHDKGLVHRDFKPDNVMVGSSDGRVRVMDFGLARAGKDVTIEVSPGESSAPHESALGVELTRRGAVIGTPAYMAPEQHLGTATDARTDQFSFCVALWEGLYGERPFRGETLATLAFAVTEGSLHEPPRGTKVPGFVRRALERGMASDPSDRFPTLESLLAELTRDPSRQRRRFAAVGAVVLAGAGIYVASDVDARGRTADCETAGAQIETVWNEDARERVRAALLATEVSYAEATSQRVDARLEDHARAWQALRTEVCLRAEVRESWTREQHELARRCLEDREQELEVLVEVLSAADSVVVRSAVTAASRLEQLAPCGEEAGLARWRRSPEAGDTRAEVGEQRRVLQRAKKLYDAGKYVEAKSVADEVRASAERLQSAPLEAEALLQAGFASERLGEYQSAETLLESAYFRAGSHGHDDVARAAATRLAYTVGSRLARIDEGLRWGKQAKMLVARSGAEAGLEAADVASMIGSVHDNSGAYELAIEHHERALAINQELLGKDHPAVASSLNNLGIVFREMGAHDRAVEHHVRALAIWEHEFGATHPTVAVGLNNLGSALEARGRFDEAVQQYERSLAIQEQALGTDHPDVAGSLGNLGIVAARRGAHEEARRYHERALAIWLDHFGPDHPTVAGGHLNLGILLALIGAHDEAIEHHGEAVAVFRKSFGPEHPAVGDALVGIGRSHHAKRRHAEAVEHLERGLSVYEASNRDSGVVARTKLALAKALVDLGSGPADVDRARSLAEAAREVFAADGADSTDELAAVESFLRDHQ